MLKQRTNQAMIRNRMNAEQRTGYALAIKYGAKKTAARIRANKVGVGAAIVSACKEIGVDRVTDALIEAENSWWALCAIRYAPLIKRWHRSSLAPLLTEEHCRHAAWVLKEFLFLSKDEKDVLRWVSHLCH